jgi:hypothetical protein
MNWSPDAYELVSFDKSEEGARLLDEEESHGSFLTVDILLTANAGPMVTWEPAGDS